jgi:hypothetical protein
MLLYSILVKGSCKKDSLIIKSRLIDDYIVIGTSRGFNSLYGLYLEALFLLHKLYLLIMV